jgi:hypothetical protein
MIKEIEMFTNPVSRLFVVLAVLTAAFATLSFINRPAPSRAQLSWPARPVISPAILARHLNYRAYTLYRQGEWLSVPAKHADAYQIFRRGEVASPVTNAEAYLRYRRGEWSSVVLPAVDLTAYHLSERSLIAPNAGLATYHRSERTFVDTQTGMATYHVSERTRIPVRFTRHQLSEWFGR